MISGDIKSDEFIPLINNEDPLNNKEGKNYVFLPSEIVEYKFELNKIGNV